MLKLTFNLSPAMVRNESLGGKDYLVVPMVMLTEGVHNGSNGPLYYPADELGKRPGIWNHKPIVVYHPEMNGEGCSACDPVILNTRMVGLILNTQYETTTNRLKAEAWLEVDKCNKVDERIMTFVENNKTMEVSTGLFADYEKVSGEFGGKTYEAIARNYQPDHLALLPDQKGACSINDGAGLLRNSIDEKKVLLNKEESKKVGLLQTISNNLGFKIIANELSHSAISSSLYQKLREKHADSKGYWDNGWIEDIFDSFVVYWNDGELFKVSYSVDGSRVELSEDVIKVTRTIKYVPVPLTNLENTNMAKKETVDALIANKATKWEEGDRAFLTGLTDEQIVKFEPVVTNTESNNNPSGSNPKDVAAAAKEGAAGLNPQTNNEEKKPQTMDEYIANSPPEMRDVLRNSVSLHNSEKKRLIDGIVANKKNTFTPEYLATQPLEFLQGLAAIAVDTPTTNVGGGVPMFYGAQGAPIGNNAPVVEEGMSLPKMEFSGK